MQKDERYVAIYARLSKEDNYAGRMSNSIAHQFEILHDYVERHNLGRVLEYQDKSTPRLIQFYTFKNAVRPPFLGGFFVSRVSAS